MPWTVNDVDEHKKGLTPSQKKEWVKIANGIYKDCIDDGGSDKTCAPKAIRIANSKFSKERTMKTEKIPKGALRFVDQGCHAFAESKDDENPKKLSMTIYSGGLIKNHFYWGDLALDLEGGRLPSKYPILEEHMNSRKIGFSSGPAIVEGGKLIVDSDKTQFVNTPASEEFQDLSSQGFPYQASHYSIPAIIERLEEGESVKVNGFTMKGPGTIWREWELQEASVAVFGWDDKTKASAFSRTETEDVDFEELKGEADDGSLSVNNKDKLKKDKEVNVMDLKELKEKHPELLDEFKKEITEDLDTKHKEELQKKEDEFSKEKKDVEDRVDKLEQENLKLSKDNTKRNEREQKALADKIWDEKLAASDISERMFKRIRKHVSYEKHMKDDKLDVESFSTAVDAEIKDWEEDGITSEVLGSGVSGDGKELETEEKKRQTMSKESDEISDRMLESVGKKQAEKNED